MDIISRLRQISIVPVVSIANAAQAAPLAESLLAGGLPCAEITFRTDAAADAIAVISKRFPEVLLGAGTVLSVEQAQRALDSGAEFIVSPGTNPVVVDYCRERGITVFPGVCTPTEIELAMSKGVDVVKFFPAEAIGGVKLLKALTAPYGQMKFIPTGGIELSNLGDYLSLPQVIACGGSWMVKPDLLSSGQFKKVTDLATEAVAFIESQHGQR